MADIVTPTLLALDIGARKHAFALNYRGQGKTGEIRNDPADIRTFLSARKANGPVRVLVEATGIYYLDLALIAAELGCEVMVINPKAAHNFAKALQRRSKTDGWMRTCCLSSSSACRSTRGRRRARSCWNCATTAAT